MSIVVNQNVSLSEREAHIQIHDRERKVSVTEESADFAGLSALQKSISYDDHSDHEEDHEDEYAYFVPIVCCDNHQDVNVYGHSIE